MAKQQKRTLNKNLDDNKNSTDENIMSQEKEDAKLKNANDDDRPMCKYGEGCYRKNPEHLHEFRHKVAQQSVCFIHFCSSF
jgi:hypothetical protein